ncbi:MAG: hypothetical protein Q7J82_06380 [Coriobacteriia bacterium]|nr:hypothetical protein [Coriobacteriia bacterium]
MILATVDGTEIDYAEGDFTLSTGEAMSAAEIVALDGEGGVAWLEESYRRWFYDNQDGIVAVRTALTPYVAQAGPEWRGAAPFGRNPVAGAPWCASGVS